MNIDILFVAHNRLRFTQQSFAALLANTDWAQVRRLCVADDASEDGTAEWLKSSLAMAAPVPAEFIGSAFGGPVAAMNWYLSLPRDAELFAKIDNDIIVCPGWLDVLWDLAIDDPDLDVLGMQPSEEAPAQQGPRTLLPARHIGGVGLIRRRIFDVCRPTPNGRFGWSEWQTSHERLRKGWVQPTLPMFGLDQLRFDPWLSLTAEYVEQGWMRPWSHVELDPGYYDWWRPV